MPDFAAYIVELPRSKHSAFGRPLLQLKLAL